MRMMIFWIMVLFSSGVFAAETPSGMLLAGTCFSCHGTDGKSRSEMPSLYGKSAASIIQTMQAYRSGALASTVMGRIAKGYDDQELEIMAAYLANIK